MILAYQNKKNVKKFVERKQQVSSAQNADCGWNPFPANVISPTHAISFGRQRLNVNRRSIILRESSSSSGSSVSKFIQQVYIVDSSVHPNTLRRKNKTPFWCSVWILTQKQTATIKGNLPFINHALCALLITYVRRYLWEACVDATRVFATVQLYQTSVGVFGNEVTFYALHMHLRAGVLYRSHMHRIYAGN